MATPSTTLATLRAPIPLKEAMPPLRLYFSLRGRIGRRQFWWHGVLGLLMAGLVLMALLEIAGVAPERAEQLANLVILWPMIAISVKRWHDRDRSGWWVLLVLVPTVIGQLWALIDNGFVAGTKGPNRFGEVPPR